VRSSMVIFCWPIGEVTVTSQVPSTADMALGFPCCVAGHYAGRGPVQGCR
jgi:hypothetical protein